MSYYVKKTYVQPLFISPVNMTKGKLDYYNPPKQESLNYNNWIAELDLRTCLICKNHHGKIYEIGEIPDEETPVHPQLPLPN